METLDPPSKSEATPRADAIPRGLPKEDGNTSASDASDRRCEDEHTAKCFIWGVDGIEDTEFEDKDKASEREGIETDEEERGPAYDVISKV